LPEKGQVPYIGIAYTGMREDNIIAVTRLNKNGCVKNVTDIDNIFADDIKKDGCFCQPVFPGAAAKSV
jgi:hypothetical protein